MLVVYCCILTFNPAKHAIPKWCTGRKWHILMAVMRWNRVGRLVEIWDKVKIPWYTHRLMHRKRVTCELHGSYFYLMTKKHAIPKILSGLLNYYITRWRQKVRSWRSESSETSVVEKARRGLGTPRELEIRWINDKMLEWEHVSERLEQPWRTIKTQRWWP